MKKSDRKGSADKFQLVTPPKIGASVIVQGLGIGTVCDWPTFGVSTVKLTAGEVVKVPHESVKVLN